MRFFLGFRILFHEQCNTMLYLNGILIHSLEVMTSYCLQVLYLATRTTQENDEMIRTYLVQICSGVQICTFR